MNERDTVPDTTAQFLESIASPDPQVRALALSFARRKGASVIPGLANVAAHTDPAIAKGAQQAMTDITHYACQPGFRAERAGVADALLGIARDTTRPRRVRAHALHLLGFAGGPVHAKAATVLEADPNIGEDARMACERIKRAA